VSANNAAGGGGGSGDGGGSFWTRFVTIRETSFNVRWLELFAAVVTGTVAVYFQALVGFLQSLGLTLERYSAAITGGLTSLIESVFGVFGIMDAAWAAAAAELAGAGIFAFVIAVAIAGLVSVIYSWGVTRLVD